MKKSLMAMLFCAVSFWTYADESPFSMGLWIEAASNNTFLIRDIAAREKKGFEFDRGALYTKANWWFWADFASRLQLDGEIGVWEVDLPLYQANSFGANVPDTTLTDGFQGLASVFFAPIFGLNGQNVGHFNKLGLNAATPYVNTRLGYGLLKGGGMSSYTGIFNVIDRWDDVGRGYMELHLGEGLSRIGDGIHLNALFALSRMRAEYGVYSLINASFFEKGEAALSFGSTSNSGELFRYNEQNENAFSFYGSYRILDSLRLAFHGLTSFGTGFDSGLNASAAAVEAEGEAGFYSWDIIASLAGTDAGTVWGDDVSVGPDSLSGSLVQWFRLNDDLHLGLDTGMAAGNIDDLSVGLFNLRNQPMLDFNMGNLIGLDMSLSLYGVLQLDRIARADDPDRSWAFRFDEAGLEVTVTDLPFMQKLVFDYAALAEYKSWNSDSGYDLNVLYHSIMVSGDISDSLSATIGSVIRYDSAGDNTVTPFAFAAGVSIKTGWVKAGSPLLWTHFVFGMDPYEDTSYSLFRADDPANKPRHRTYILNHLSDYMDKSRFSVGFVWEL